MLGFGVANGSAWLGGHLSFRKGVGVNQTAFERLPGKWTAVLDQDELEEGTLGHASVDGADLVVVKQGRKVHALADRCSHRGCPLHEGTLEDDLIVCRCHGSTFRLDTSVIRGPATAPQPALEARVRTGKRGSSPAVQLA
jgi:nitrite reductase/ring-hydroxylating ferredoxin subunit